MNILPTVGIIGAALTGSGGVGYAIIQWLLKRSDPEVQANAARVLTNAAAGIIAELQKEKKDLHEEIQLFKNEVSVFKASVRNLIYAVEDVIPLLAAPELEELQSAMRHVREKM